MKKLLLFVGIFCAFSVGLGFAIITPTPTTKQQEPIYFMIPNEQSRTTEFHLFAGNNLSKPYAIVHTPTENKGKYIVWGASYNKAVYFSNKKAYVIGHRNDGGAEQDVDFYVFEISQSGDVKKVASLGKGFNKPVTI